MIGTTVPTVIPSGDTQFNRQQDQTNASLLSLGGGTRRGNNYTLDGVPITDLRNRASRQPDDRSARGREGAGAHLRRGDGAHRRRRVQHDAEVRAPTAFTAPASTRPGRSGARRTTTSASRGAARAASRTARTTSGGGGFGGPIVKNRTFFWFATENYHDVQTRNASEIMPTARERARRLLGDDQRGRPAASIIYDPLTRQPFAGQQHPGEPHQPGRRRRC